MDWFSSTLQIALGAGLATTFDDNIYLTGFFSEVNRTFRPEHVAAGELVGFTALILISLIGFTLGLAFPQEKIGLLGLLPILIGVQGFLQYWRSRNLPAEGRRPVHRPSVSSQGFESLQPSLPEVLLDRQTYNVALVAISNGSNNLSIYIPLFASLSILKTAIVIPVLYGFILTWLFLSFNLTRAPGIALALTRYSRMLFPFILMWLGFRILKDTGALAMLMGGGT